MKKRFLRETDIDPDEALPENVVQVVHVSRRYLVGIEKGQRIYSSHCRRRETVRQSKIRNSKADHFDTRHVR